MPKPPISNWPTADPYGLGPTGLTSSSPGANYIQDFSQLPIGQNVLQLPQMFHAYAMGLMHGSQLGGGTQDWEAQGQRNTPQSTMNARRRLGGPR